MTGEEDVARLEAEAALAVAEREALRASEWKTAAREASEAAAAASTNVERLCSERVRGIGALRQAWIDATIAGDRPAAAVLADAFGLAFGGQP